MNTTDTTLQIGQRVHCILYGGRDGIVTAIHGDQHRGNVSRNIGGVIFTGGACRLDIIWDDGSQSPSTPEAIIHSVQWRILDEVVSADEVARHIALAATYKAQQQAAKEAEAQRKAEADAQALAAGTAMGLMPEAEFRAAGKRGHAAVHNLRTELKKAGIKARVTADGYNCLRVNDVAPEQREQAKAIGHKYKAGHFDGMTDCYEYSSTAWGRVFGDVQYVFFG